MSWVWWFLIGSAVFLITVKIAEKIVVKKKKNNDIIENVETKENDTEIKEG